MCIYASFIHKFLGSLLNSICVVCAYFVSPRPTLHTPSRSFPTRNCWENTSYFIYTAEIWHRQRSARQCSWNINWKTKRDGLKILARRITRHCRRREKYCQSHSIISLQYFFRVNSRKRVLERQRWIVYQQEERKYLNFPLRESFACFPSDDRISPSKWKSLQNRTKCGSFTR